MLLTLFAQAVLPTCPTGTDYIVTYENKTLPLFTNCKTLKTVTISEGFTSISENAFYDCSNLEYVSIPNSVKRIEKRHSINALAYCISRFQKVF